MQKSISLTLLLILVLALGACNFPGSPSDSGPRAPVTRLVTMTSTVGPAPTATSLPPTATPPPPPSDTPPPPPPPNTEGPPPATPVPPTATRPPATVALITPIPRALFTATFDGGTFTFRTHDNSKIVIPKTVNVKGAKCNEGGNMSDHITFEPPPFFDIDPYLKFSMSQGTQVTISGQFFSANSARGTITLHLKSKNANCTIGPLSWTASAASQ